MYGRRQYLTNLTMMGVVDTVHTLFSSPPHSHQQHSHSHSHSHSDSSGGLGTSGGVGVGSVPGFLRSMGMLGVQGLGPLKARIAQLAMGGKG